MAKDELEIKYPLEKVSLLAAAMLPSSEYLLDRHDIKSDDDYLRISVTASWIPEYSSAQVNVVFEGTADQAARMKSLLADETCLDDIDSGLGEAFEEAFSQVYPDADGVGIGRTSAKFKTVKK
jgi:hypothetical protein